jgi:hypothetical protein
MKRTPAVVAVLAAVRDLDGPNGYQIARHARIKPATIYRVRDRLLDEEWITARTDGPRRRYYLTPLGESWADTWTRPVGETPTRVRRKADDVWVIRWAGTNWPAVSAFCPGARRDGDELRIPTVDGNIETCRLGWWIVRGVNNHYPIPPNVFDATYELPPL